MKNWFINLGKSKIFLGLLISFLIGVFVGDLVKFSSDIFYLTLLVIFALVLIGIFWFKYKYIIIISSFMMMIFIGQMYIGWYKEKNFVNNLPYGEKIEFTGIVNDEPSLSADKTKLIIKVENSSDSRLVNSQVLVYVPNYPKYQYGDRLKIAGTLDRPENFNNFDYQSYLARYLIFSIVKQHTNVECINKGIGSKIKSWLIDVKNKFAASIEKSLPEPASSLAEGLLIGSGTNFSDDLKNDMKSTGTTHIVVVSGQNMEIVSSVFVQLTQYWSRLATFSIGSIGLLLYSILTGASASVVRAAILASLFLLARLVGRKKKIINPLFFTAFIMVLINPLILKYDIGFQLSFLAMLGLIFFTPIFQKIFIKIKWPDFIKQSLFATLSAQAMTLPILFYNFGQFSIIAPITNVLILSVVPYGMLASFLVGIGGIVNQNIGSIFTIIAWPMLEYIIKIIEYFAKIPHVLLKINWQSGYFILLYYIIVGLIIIKLAKKYEIKY